MKKTTEEFYQEFRQQGWTHQQARELALKAQELQEKEQERMAEEVKNEQQMGAI